MYLELVQIIKKIWSGVVNCFLAEGMPSQMPSQVIQVTFKTSCQPRVKRKQILATAVNVWTVISAVHNCNTNKLFYRFTCCFALDSSPTFWLTCLKNRRRPKKRKSLQYARIMPVKLVNFNLCATTSSTSVYARRKWRRLLKGAISFKNNKL